MNQKTGFTLVEIMIVVAVIGLIAAIAMLNFIRARETSQATLCSQSLERLDGAKVLAAFEFNLGDLDVPTDDQLIPFFSAPFGTAVDGSSDLCPAGGTYSVNDVASPPTCSLAGGPGWHEIQ
ncbi:MAG TPA: type II secretion system protein [Firmicutes bacterium]|nr:type II secretion system protein [Bacillota bacterium]